MTKLDDKKVLVLYHADCMDGFAAAWAAWKEFNNKAYYKAVRHYNPLPDFADGSMLYIVDFCYPMQELVEAAQRAKKIVVLDHHISAQKDFEAYQKHSPIPGNVEMNFIQSHSGCMIVWQYFQGDAEPPVLLKHIEDHDLWRHQLPQTEEICRALHLRLPVSFAEFEKLKLPSLQGEGALLLKQQQKNVTRLLKARHGVKLNGISGLAVNAPSMFSSDLGHELAELSGTFGLSYFYQGKRQRYECSLRSVGEFDVSVIAHEFGGGGHRNAAGFSVKQADFLKFII